MEALFSGVVATLVTFPFIGYVLTFILTKQITKKHRQAVSVSIYVSSVLLVCAAHFFIFSIWHISMLWVLLMIVIIIAMIVVIVHYKMKEEIVMTHVIKGVFRINNFIFSIIYVLLAGYGIVSNVMKLLY